MFKDEVLSNTTSYDYYKTKVQKLTTYFIDFQGNLNDIENPFNKYINYEHDIINPEVSQNTDLLFSLLNVTLDNNFIFSGNNSLTKILSITAEFHWIELSNFFLFLMIQSLINILH
jgi:hypothetical protein